jgi:hypothetical protein
VYAEAMGNKNVFKSPSLVIALGLILLATATTFWFISHKNPNASQTKVVPSTSSWIRISTYTIENGGYDFTDSADYNLDPNGSMLVVRKHNAKTNVYEGFLPIEFSNQIFAVFDSSKLQNEQPISDLDTILSGKYFSVHVTKNGETKTYSDVSIKDAEQEYQEILEKLQEQVKKFPLAENIRAILVATPLDGAVYIEGDSSFRHHVLNSQEWDSLPTLRQAVDTAWKYTPVRNPLELEKIKKYVLFEPDRGAERYIVTTPQGRYDLGLFPSNSEQ